MITFILFSVMIIGMAICLVKAGCCNPPTVTVKQEVENGDLHDTNGVDSRDSGLHVSDD